LTVTMEMECILSPNNSEGHLLLRVSDCEFGVSNGQEVLGRMGAACGGAFFGEFKDAKGATVFRVAPEVQWSAFAKALKEQYQVESLGQSEQMANTKGEQHETR